MKRNILFIMMLVALTGLVTMQSCNKETSTPPQEFLAPVPVATTPAVGEIIPFTGANQSINLSWEGTATNPIKWDVYFGDSDAPDKVASNVTTNTYVAKVSTGGTYYWQVYTIDENGMETYSPLWEFQVNSKPAISGLVPANNATKVSKTVSLTWTGTDPEDDHLTYDVYLGTTATPGPVATGLTTNSYSPTLAYNTTYYWKVVVNDPYGGSATSAVQTFKTDVQQPDYNVFNGISSELAPSISATATKNVTVQRLGASNTIALYLPLADAMVSAGWGTVYTGTHPIIITYDPVTLVVTGAKQAWCDSFIDPTEMGPMSLTVAAGSTIDPLTKKISIVWIVSGNAYWGTDYTMRATTYTMK
jgi:hypothetical protein